MMLTNVGERGKLCSVNVGHACVGNALRPCCHMAIYALACLPLLKIAYMLHQFARAGLNHV